MERSLRNYMSLDPWEAVIALVNDAYNLSLNPARTQLVSMEPYGVEMRITLRSERSPGTGNLLPPFEQQTFQYTRLELGNFFRMGYIEPFIFHPVGYPTTTLEASEILTLQSGVVFGRNDLQHFELLAPLTAPVEVLAHPLSLRWYGTLMILPGVSQVGDLHRYIPNRKLDALAYPDWAGLYGYLPNRDLDALTMPNFS